LLTSSVAVSGTVDSLNVVLPSGESHSVKVVGTAPEVDLALLALPDDLMMGTPPALPLADSDALSEGDFLVALGDPSGPNGGAVRAQRSDAGPEQQLSWA
jgi:S1-C subfamily serine protease